MQQNTGNTYAETIAKRLTDISKNTSQKTQKSLKETALYRRVGLVPNRLASILLAALWVEWIIVSYIGFGNSFGAGIAFAFLMPCAFVVCFIVKSYLQSIMMRHRLWYWLKPKFKTRQEMAAWLKLTHPMYLEHVASIPDHEQDMWSPNPKGGIWSNDAA